MRAMPSLEMQTSEMSFHVEAHAGWSKELLESLFDAVEDLRSSLRSINSDLLIWTGHTAEVLLALAHEVGGQWQPHCNFYWTLQQQLMFLCVSFHVCARNTGLVLTVTELLPWMTDWCSKYYCRGGN